MSNQKSELDMEMSNPAGRFGHDTDMGACISFLAGPGSVFLNSQSCILMEVSLDQRTPIFPYADINAGNILVQVACT
jgi:hypothetical protein